MTIQELPIGSAPKALDYAHFPAPHLGVIWRNWNRVSPKRLAEVLETSEANILAAAAEMGLVRDDRALDKYMDRGFQTLIRYNWQLLNYEQLLKLLNWTPEKLEFTLLEDDFLFVKLSFFKPQCDKVVYRELSDTEHAAVAEIAKTMKEVNARLPETSEAPFDFIAKFGQKPFTGKPDATHLKMIFSYAAVYGDALLPEAPDPFPESILRDYASCGVNAVWMPGILYQLIPYLGKDMPLSARCDERLAKLKAIAQRCRKYGIGLFLYFNEPRGIPARIKLEHEEWRGPVHASTGSRSFCPWAPGMLENLSDGIEKLCRAVPELGGIYTITQSENVTHCLARDLAPVDPDDPPLPSEMATDCPACHQHSKAENIAAVMKAIDDGIQKSGTAMRLIAYTWSWEPQWDRQLLEMLPKNVEIMNVSETGVESHIGGVLGKVRDYSISKVGPGAQAQRMWKMAKETGHVTVAKIQANTSWEMGGIPSIPVPTLVEEHLDNLRKIGVENIMLSWTLGGYPGGNLELLKHRATELADLQFGPFGKEVYAVWRDFGEAFRGIPFHDAYQIYYSPQNVGPANLLYEKKTGLAAGMVCGIPYDDLDLWSGNGHYPADVMENAFRDVSEKWGVALEKLRAIGTKLDAQYRANFEELWSRAEGTYCCLRSTYCQIAFICLRDAGKLDATRALIDEEESLALRLLKVVKSDSRIGFEAANHYFYGENELREKIIQCRYLRKKLFA